MATRKPAKKQVEADEPAKTKPADIIAAVSAKYTDHNWVVVVPPAGSINDLVAQKGTKFHFIQIVTPETADSAKFTGIAKNTFVQNAFSNAAVPVHAHVVVKNRRSGISMTVTFEDVNTENRVIIGAKKKPAEKSEDT